MKRLLRPTLILAALTLLATLTACGNSGGGSGRGPGGNPASSNRARFLFDVDLQGIPGELVMEVEILGNTGITWGPGVNPDITGVISTGSDTVYTAGELRSPVAYYVFNGENSFADFTEPATFQRFRVQWVETPRGLQMIVNPFGPGPVTYDCVLRESQRL